MKTLLLALSLLPLSAFASVSDDIALIRTLLPAGSDIAQIQSAILNGSNSREAEKYGETNYLIRDINGDRLADILVISEVNPRLEQYPDNQPCSNLEDPNCMIVYGGRSLLFFTGNAQGNFKLNFENKNFIMGADEGGVFGDPLEGLRLLENGSIAYSVYGGSSWRWSYTDTFSFRRGHLYVTGQDSYSGWTGDLRSDTKSVNLITGDVITTHQEHAEAPVKTKRFNVPVKPLVTVSAYAGQQEE